MNNILINKGIILDKYDEDSIRVNTQIETLEDIVEIQRLTLKTIELRLQEAYEERVAINKKAVADIEVINETK